MKLPTYAIKKAVSVPTANYNDPQVEFPGGTLVFPFWNTQWLPANRKEELKDAIKLNSGWNSGERADLVMCMIGRYWIPIERSNICRRD